MGKIKTLLKILLLLFLLLAVIWSYVYFTGHTHSELANTDIGYVTKDVYNYYHSNNTLVVITGIHPREKLSIEPEIESVREFAVKHRVNLINYNVTVTKDAEDYSKGRANGEKLVAEQILPDINQTNAKVVIISHSHIEGYGDGFYVATPEMDEQSVTIAQAIENSDIDFNYFPVTGEYVSPTTSAKLVSKPLAQSGYPTLVYEIPENITENDATYRTYQLIDECYATVTQMDALDLFINSALLPVPNEVVDIISHLRYVKE